MRRPSVRFCAVLAAAWALGCGSDNGTLFGPDTDGGGGGASALADGAASGGGSGSGTGGDSSTGGTGGASSGAGGASGGMGGTSTGGAATGGMGGTSAGGATGGMGGTSTGGATGGMGGAGGADAGTTTCADITCDAPATCTTGDGGAPACVCPPGYDDVNGDGTSCVCASGYTDAGGVCKKENTQGCSADTDCASGHCVGGTCCAVACDAPDVCEKLDGTVCVNGDTCRYGKIADDTSCDDGDPCTNSVCFDGACVVDSSKDCSDGDKCTVDACDADGQCTHDPIDCDDGNPCTTDTCSPSAGCQYSDNDAGSCTDGDPCTVDVCSKGVCESTAKDCSSFDDDCNVGVCNAGSCQAQPVNQSKACNDGLTACDSSGICNASGICVGQDDACGSLAASCATCSSGTGCYQGRLCTCQSSTPPEAPIIRVNGMCVHDTDECNADPCDPLAVSCNDPTPGGAVDGDVVCTCPDGYTGDGLAAGQGCVDIDECDGANPCGPGVASGGCDGTSPAGGYSCTCDAGYTSIDTPSGPFCACDLGGTYVMVTKSTVKWDAVYDPIFGTITLIEASPPEGVETYSWSLRHQTIAQDGSITVETIPCGGTTPDLCSPFGSGAALAQYQANQIWGESRIDDGFPALSSTFETAVPGGSYSEPDLVAISGLSLADPSGQWPPCRACVGLDVGQQCTCADGTHTVTNKATWVDADQDGPLGVTTFAVLPGGKLIDGTFPDPPYDYTTPSNCPYDYEPWPGYAGGATFTTFEWYSGVRVISRLVADTITFDSSTDSCILEGSLEGPDGAPTPQSEGRFQGCMKCGATCTEADGELCDDAEVAFYDDVEQSQQVTSATFTLERSQSIDLGPILAMPDGPAKKDAINQACAEVREANCPPGKSCAVP